MDKLRLLKLSLLFLCLITQSVSSSFAQEGASSEDLLSDTKKDLMIVGAMGGVGAVLGLSTLSFVDEPKDHLKNIVVGSAIGVIVGVGLVAWMQANKSQNQFNSVHHKQPDFSTQGRLKWHQHSHEKLNVRVSAATATQFQFSF